MPAWMSGSRQFVPRAHTQKPHMVNSAASPKSGAMPRMPRRQTSRGVAFGLKGGGFWPPPFDREISRRQDTALSRDEAHSLLRGVTLELASYANPSSAITPTSE